MSLSNRRFLAIAMGLVMSACSAGGVGTRDDGGSGTGDGSQTGGDGSHTGGDGSQTGGDGSVNHGDGSVNHGDGSTTGDGSQSGGDGGTTTGDGATGDDVIGGGDGGSSGCGPTEICGNGVDDNCNGRVDEACSCQPGQTQQCYDGDPAQAGRGVCTFGTQTCEGTGEFGDWGTCVGAGHPTDVVCGGGMDYHCDGVIDEGCACTPGTTRPCYSGPAGTEGVGLCHAGSQTCENSGGVVDWGACTGDVIPQPELCDGADRDCDGTANSNCTCVVGTSRLCYDGPAGTEGVGLCHSGAQTCIPGADGTGSQWGTCMDEVVPSAETCDGEDHLCNGMPGAGCACTVGASRPCYTGAPSSRNVGACHDGTQNCVSAAGGSTWSSTCSGETTPVGEVCMNRIDDNCNGQTDEGCGGTLTCPGNQTVNAGSPITLTVAGMGITNITWTVISGPTGGASTVVWSPAPPTALTESFTPTIVGDYVIQVSGRDSSGATVSCMFTVSALPHGLRVELTWDGTGDVDLHLHNSNNTAWFSYSSPDDCYYGQTSTPWGANLDFDNTSANGPENIRVDTPTVSSAYTIAVHNYARAQGRIATVKVFCGSTTSTLPTQTFTSHALQGSSSGQCTNDFWKVARIVFTSPTACTITAINTYTTSNSPCNSF